MNLPFVDNIRRADRDNTIDLYIGEDYMDVLAEGEWQKFFKEKPPVFTREEKREHGWIRIQMWHLAPMHSSHSEITLKEHTRAV